MTMGNGNNTSVASEPGAELDMPCERREAAKKHAALLSETAKRVAHNLPLQADVDDFRRVLIAQAHIDASQGKVRP
jgi:hypothetical protein